jgi:hypothetical protein
MPDKIIYRFVGEHWVKDDKIHRQLHLCSGLPEYIRAKTYRKLQFRKAGITELYSRADRNGPGRPRTVVLPGNALVAGFHHRL